MEVLVLMGEGYKWAIIDHYKKDTKGNLIGTKNTHPLLNKRVYKVRFPAGKGTETAENRGTESILKTYNTDGNEHLIFREILDHKCYDREVSKTDIFIHHMHCNPK